MTARIGARRVWGLGLIVLIAIVVRVAAVWAWGAPPLKDALEYHSIAVNLISGHGYAMRPDVPTDFRPPVYPLFLAVIYRLSGVDYHHALYVQVVLNALLVLPLFWLARRLTGSEACGYLAAALFAVHTSFEIVSRLYAENLLIPLGLGFVIGAYRMVQKGSGGFLPSALVTGTCAGLMGLTKPEYALLGVFFLGVALLVPAWRRHWRGALVTALVSLAFVGAWHVRNLSVAPPKTEVLVANRDLLRPYVYPALSGIWWYPVSDMKALEAFRQRERAFYARIKNPEAVRNKAIAVMKSHPVGVLKLIVSRTLILWFSPPTGTTLLSGLSPWLKWVGMGAQYLFVGLGLWMLLALAGRRPEVFPALAFAAYMTAVYGLIHAIRRYGYPFVPELCVFAAWGSWMAWRCCGGTGLCRERGTGGGSMRKRDGL